MQDIINGLLDDFGPMDSGERWGVAVIVPDKDGIHRFGFA
jgi:hypothetical protein